MLLNRANFVGVFVGIESPDTATLIAMRKKQNTRRSIAHSIHKIYAAGLFVTAGFIVGFDSETESVADAMVELIEEAAIPVCMVGLLYALPNTQLTRRLEKEGRLHPHCEREDVKSADQCTMGLNFDDAATAAGDSRRLCAHSRAHIRSSGLCRPPPTSCHDARQFRPEAARHEPQHSRRGLGRLEMLHRIMTNLPEPRDLFRRTLTECFTSNPKSTSRIVLFMALYLDVGRILARRHWSYREHDRRARASRRPASAERPGKCGMNDQAADDDRRQLRTMPVHDLRCDRKLAR